MAAVCNYEFVLTLERNLKETTTENTMSIHLKTYICYL